MDIDIIGYHFDTYWKYVTYTILIFIFSRYGPLNYNKPKQKCPKIGWTTDIEILNGHWHHWLLFWHVLKVCDIQNFKSSISRDKGRYIIINKQRVRWKWAGLSSKTTKLISTAFFCISCTHCDFLMIKIIYMIFSKYGPL